MKKVYIFVKNTTMATSIKKQTPFHLSLQKALDGRTNRWLSLKTGIHESEISRIVSGRLVPTEAQSKKIIKAIPFSFI